MSCTPAPRSRDRHLVLKSPKGTFSAPRPVWGQGDNLSPPCCPGDACPSWSLPVPMGAARLRAALSGAPRLQFPCVPPSVAEMAALGRVTQIQPLGSGSHFLPAPRTAVPSAQRSPWRWASHML